MKDFKLEPMNWKYEMKKLLLLPLLLLAGCQSYMLGINSAGQVRHIVICWLKPDANKQAVIQSCNELQKIPGVIDVSIGEKIASERSVVDSSFDLALIVTFDNTESLKAYDQHPIHLKVLNDVVKPNVAKLTIYDSTVAEYTVGTEVTEAIRARRMKAMQLQRDIVDRAH